MLRLVRFSFSGFILGAFMAAIVIFIYMLFLFFLPRGFLHETLLEADQSIFLVMVWTLEFSDIEIAPNNLRMWIFCVEIVLASGIFYFFAFLFAGLIDHLRLKLLKKRKSCFSDRIFFYKTSDWSWKRVLGASFFGFYVGFFVAALITATRIVIFGYFSGTGLYDVIDSEISDGITLFMWPSFFATISIREMSLSSWVYVLCLALMNGVRYFVLFAIFWHALKYMGRCTKWLQTIRS